MTDIDYGPLTQLIGTWQGDQGQDISPESDGIEENPYYETVTYEAAGDLTNAEEQNIAILFYRQIVRRKSNDEVFHDQTGYWMWDGQTQTVMQSLTIPRGLCLLAGCTYQDKHPNEDTVSITVKAAMGDPDWDIIQSPFMREKAATTAYSHVLTVCGDQLTYSENMTLDIYGRIFDHTDTNKLTKIS